MKLYYSRGACSLACRIILNELGLAPDYISVNIKDKDKKTEYGEEFLKVNPKGAVPTLVTDDNQVLTENAVIQQYLADTNHAETLLPAVPKMGRYKVLELLNFIATDIHKGYGLVFNPNAPDAVKKDIAIPNLMKKFAYIEKVLGKNKFLTGDNFTLPDGYLFTMLMWANKQKFDMAQFPELTRYYEDMKKYPAVAQSLLQEELA
jgi:glutathione S-transferase